MLRLQRVPPKKESTVFRSQALIEEREREMLVALLLLGAREAPGTPLWVVLPLLFLFGLLSFHPIAKQSSPLRQWTRMALCVSAWTPQRLVLILPIVVLCRTPLTKGSWVSVCNWLALATLGALALSPRASITAMDPSPMEVVTLVLVLFAAAVSSPASPQHLVAAAVLVLVRQNQALALGLEVWLLLPALYTELPPLVHVPNRVPLYSLYVVVSAVALGACAALWQPLLVSLLSLHMLFFICPPAFG